MYRMLKNTKSIICTYTHKRADILKKVVLSWECIKEKLRNREKLRTQLSTHNGKS